MLISDINTLESPQDNHFTCCCLAAHANLEVISAIKSQNGGGGQDSKSMKIPAAVLQQVNKS
jgi:hypothetical protein